MNRKRLILLSVFALISISLAVVIVAHASSNDAPEPRAKNGKKLLTSLDLLKIAAVTGPRISPDGTRVAYLVSETKMEKDKEWKAVNGSVSCESLPWFRLCLGYQDI